MKTTMIRPSASALVLPLLVAALALAPGRACRATILTIDPASSTVLPGQSQDINVDLTASGGFANFAAGDVALSVDPSRFQISNVKAGSGDTGFTVVSSVNANSTPGELTASIYDPTGNGVALTAGAPTSILSFTLTALANAPVGGAAGNISFQSGFGNTTTDAFDANGNQALIGPNVNGTILVSGPAVPEPGSLALLGLGLGALGVPALRRARRRSRAGMAA